MKIKMQQCQNDYVMV